MKKTLIALALATLSTASMAEVVLYGEIKGGVEVAKQKGVSGTETKVVDYGSFIGFKGQENLGGNLRAIWQLETSVNIAGGSASNWESHDSFVGVAGDLGTIKAGYQETPLKAVRKVDQWEYDNGAVAVGLGVFTRDNDASKRAVAISYETPNMAGVSAKVYVSPSDNNNGEKGDNLTASDRKNTDSAIYGASVSYENNGLFADVAGTYVRHGKMNSYYSTFLPNEQAKKYGYQALAQVGYDADQWFAALAYQHSSNVDNGKSMSYVANTAKHPDRLYLTSANELALSGAYKVSESLKLKASAVYGWGLRSYAALSHGQDRRKVYSKVDNSKYYQLIAGVDYALSKRTVANAQAGYLQFGKANKNNRGGALSVGMSHKF